MYCSPKRPLELVSWGIHLFPYSERARLPTAGCIEVHRDQAFGPSSLRLFFIEMGLGERRRRRRRWPSMMWCGAGGGSIGQSLLSISCVVRWRYNIPFPSSSPASDDGRAIAHRPDMSTQPALQPYLEGPVSPAALALSAVSPSAVFGGAPDVVLESE